MHNGARNIRPKIVNKQLQGISIGVKEEVRVTGEAEGKRGPKCVSILLLILYRPYYYNIWWIENRNWTIWWWLGTKMDGGTVKANESSSSAYSNTNLRSPVSTKQPICPISPRSTLRSPILQSSTVMHPISREIKCLAHRGAVSHSSQCLGSHTQKD